MAGFRSHEMKNVEIIPVTGLPEIKKGDALAPLILNALETGGVKIRNRDVLVLAQKIVSKAERQDFGFEKRRAVSRSDRYREPRRARPETRRGGARRVERNRRRFRARALIVEHRTGAVCAHAGVDRSNLRGGEDEVLLLPRDADLSARKLHEEIKNAANAFVPVLIADTQGRAFRAGRRRRGDRVRGS